MFLHAPTVIRIRRLLYAIILGRKYSIRSGTNNYFYRSCKFRFEYINVLNNIHERFLNCYCFILGWYVCKKVDLLGILINQCITRSWLTMPYFVDTSQPQGRYPQDRILHHHKQARLILYIHLDLCCSVR
jgi:hypothetical protein